MLAESLVKRQRVSKSATSSPKNPHIDSSVKAGHRGSCVCKSVMVSALARGVERWAEMTTQVSAGHEMLQLTDVFHHPLPTAMSMLRPLCSCCLPVQCTVSMQLLQSKFFNFAQETSPAVPLTVRCERGRICPAGARFVGLFLGSTEGEPAHPMCWRERCSFGSFG